jgi:sugar lactone lactonase YvrE
LTICYASSITRTLASLIVAVTCAAAFAEQPRIDSLSPAQGPIAGGTIVTIAGANFAGAAVKIGRDAATLLSQTDSEIRLRMPAHDNGYGVISVRSGTGAAYAEFLYLPPRLSEIPPGYITTIAGIGEFTRAYGRAVNATIPSPWALEFDSAGNLYVPDAATNRIHRITPDGMIEHIAGGANTLGDGGPAIDAGLPHPQDIALDGRGNVYIGSGGCRIRKVAPDGTISTVAGDGVCGFAGDGGPATQAHLGVSQYMVADASDLFFIDWDAMRIRRLHFADNTISTFAGNGTRGFSGDGGLATQASFDIGTSDDGAIALDPSGNVVFIDDTNGRIRRIDRQSGIITTLFNGSRGARSLATDKLGNLYFGGSGTITQLNAKGEFVRSWGNGTYALPIDGAPAATSGLGHVLGIAIDAAGNVVYSDEAIGRVRRINIATGLLETIAGIGPNVIGENGPALATVTHPNGITFDRDGKLLITETLRLRRLESDGRLTTIGGTGSFVGRQAPARVNEVVIAATSVFANADGSLDMADLSVIDHVDATGALRWIAGTNGVCDYSGDGGAATNAALCQAWDMTRDAAGNLFIADTNNNRIRRVDAVTNVITTVAGNGGPVNGYERYWRDGRSCGDGGPALDSCLNTPHGVTVDAAGNLFISELEHIRRVDAQTKIITTLADALNTTKIVFDRAGYLYASNGTGLFRFDRAGRMTQLTRGGLSPALGDGGPALDANTVTGGQAVGVAIDGEGNVFFSDVGNARVRAIRYGAVLAPPNASVVMTANSSTLRAVVRDASGALTPGVRVDFTTPSSGASCTLSSPFAITDVNGVATVSCASNCVAGTYSITARPLTAAATATASMTNGAGPCRRRSVSH